MWSGGVPARYSGGLRPHTDQAEFVHIRGKLQSLLDEETFTAASLEGWYLGIELAIGLAEKVLGGDEV